MVLLGVLCILAGDGGNVLIWRYRFDFTTALILHLTILTLPFSSSA